MKARLPKGPPGGGDMQSMLRQAQKMQEEMETLREELDLREYTVKAGGGMVEVSINGKGEVFGLSIQPEIVDPEDIETLSDILIAAFNEASKTVAETNDREMSKVTSAAGIPGMPGF